jgi:hypothetical protein
MYGVSYFKIKNKKGTELWLGVDPFGLKMYQKEQKIQPETVFRWSEIIDFSIDSNKFVIKINEANRKNKVNKKKKISTVAFTVYESEINSKIVNRFCKYIEKN